jgi:adenylate cyclase
LRSLKLIGVYADALARVAEAEVRLFHFYVHEGLKAAGLSGQKLLDSRKSVRDDLLPVPNTLAHPRVAGWLSGVDLSGVTKLT